MGNEFWRPQSAGDVRRLCPRLSAQRTYPIARVTGAATAGVLPRIMGIGPVPATRKLLTRQHLEIHDIHVLELNESFAAQSLAVLRELGLEDDAEHVNPNGGALALGHPLGASGAAAGSDRRAGVASAQHSKGIGDHVRRCRARYLGCR